MSEERIYCTDPKTGKRFSFVPLSPERMKEIDEAENRANDRRKALDKDHDRSRAYAKSLGLIR
jgi:hypothetical protein